MVITVISRKCGWMVPREVVRINRITISRDGLLQSKNTKGKKQVSNLTVCCLAQRLTQL